MAQLSFSEGFIVGCHHLVSVAATAGCGVIGFMTELGAPVRVAVVHFLLSLTDIVF